MKKYRVNVNGTVYEVEIEEMTGAPAAAPAAAAAPSANAEVIAAPMPGNVLSVKVAVGEQVKKGQILMILEAMKMENEIICPRDGRVSSIPVASGATVDTGNTLIVIE